MKNNLQKNENYQLAKVVQAKETHALAQSYYSVAEEYAYKFYMELKKIRDEKLFHELKYKTFAEYCEGAWGLTRQIIYERIQLAERFEEDDFVSHGLQFGHKKSLLLARMDDETRDSVLSDGIPTESGMKPYEDATRAEIEQYRKSLKEQALELSEVNKTLKDQEDYHKLIEEDNEKLQKQLQVERNKPTRVETKTIEKVVDKTDYETINKIKEENERNKTLMERLTRDKELLERRLQQEESDANEHRKLKEDLQMLSSQREDLHRQIEAATSLSKVSVEIEHLLKNELAPIRYSRAITEAQDSEVAMNNLSDIIGLVEDWARDMRNYLPNTYKNTTIINAEVIDYE